MPSPLHLPSNSSDLNLIEKIWNIGKFAERCIARIQFLDNLVTKLMNERMEITTNVTRSHADNMSRTVASDFIRCGITQCFERNPGSWLQR
ncbi:hypothetical protein NPIL_633591 [Nephila pilipes]|uniref:Uncharacterized protein n=1 Tax=Nephila pilipes TaxID=299642 RepID=A0A8X6PT17_NEPPI|nr:hypothetical protein NPIL_633591 [Nephila pilipes]